MGIVNADKSTETQSCDNLEEVAAYTQIGFELVEHPHYFLDLDPIDY